MAEEQPEFMDPLEDCSWLPARQIFQRLGFEPVPPNELNALQLTGRLWEFIYALAARRFFLSFTNHLDDRQLYEWLYAWLDEDEADIPPEAGWNCHLDPTQSGDATIYLRYYADEEARAAWAEDFPEDVIPPHEELPFDRDRFLPVPPVPLPSPDEDLPADLLVEDDETDPLGLNAVDREIAANKESPSEFDGGSLESESEVDVELDLSSTDLENWKAPAQQLVEENIPLLPPAELTDETLTPILWELLHNLSLRGFYVLSTDHLCDRDLYSELWTRGLREPALLPGRNAMGTFGGWFHDFLGSGSEESVQLLLRYYYDEEQREELRRESPELQIPPKEKPPFNRDWRLPKGPF